jgi:23S rRNA pseudouridine1911/1915/1917 synthase
MEPGGLSILYADGHLIAADKPAGIHTAPLGKGGEPTLLDMIMERYPEVSKLPGIKSIEPGLLHRLDRETSGLVVVARTSESFGRLRRDFAGSRVKKEYLAIVSVPEKEPAVAEGSVLRIQSRFAPYGPGRKMVRVVPLSRKAAGAVYQTEARIEKLQGGLALVRAVVNKGFRHQVRAHLWFLGLPIVGDPLYGTPVPAGAPQRMYLHALSVRLDHPATGEPLVIASPIPKEFGLLLSWNPEPRPWGCFSSPPT